MKLLAQFAVALLTIAIAAASVAVTPGPPRQIGYQGRLTDASGTPLPDGAKSIRFIIWNSPTLSTPAHEVWNSGPLTVTTTSGLFSVMLGVSPQPVLTPGILSDTLRWLGITVGADPEISPRTRLASVPYAYNSENAQYAVDASSAVYADSAGAVSDKYVKLAGDTMTGDLIFDNDASGIDIWLDNTSTGGNLKLYHDGVSTATLYGEGQYGTLILRNNLGNSVVELDGNRGSGGILYLNQQDATSGMILKGGLTTDGATAQLYNAGGTNTITLDADIIGDGAADLPDSAISAAEIWNEPGIVANDENSLTNLSSTAMTDLATVSITIPAAGYIIVQAKANTTIYGTRSMNYGYVQIDETSGGLTASPYFVTFGMDSTLTTGDYSFPAYVHRVYYKSAGTYTFRLEGMAYSSNGAGAVTRCLYPMIVATYCPTAYGTVNTFATSAVGSRSGSMSASSSSFPSSPDNPATSEASIRVDLRELELKAARAQAEAERAQRALTEARLRQEMTQNQR